MQGSCLGGGVSHLQCEDRNICSLVIVASLNLFSDYVVFKNAYGFIAL